MLPLADAKALVLLEKQSYGTELVSIEDCQNRILAEDIYADRDYPPFNRAAMDGFAILYTDWEKGVRKYTIQETIYAGDRHSKELEAQSCYKIMTGSAVPLYADTIIRVEDSAVEGNLVRFPNLVITKGQNIANKGQDAKKNKIIASKGFICDFRLVGVLASVGKDSILVKKIPAASVISTGNELRQPRESVNEVQIRDSNSFVIQSFLRKYDINATRNHAIDDKAALKQKISVALGAELVIISGGVSAGDTDYLPDVLKELGVIQLFHKVQIKPGKPIWVGRKENTMVFSMPGNPVSVQVGLKLFVEPYLRACFDLVPLPSYLIPISEKRIKKGSLDEFFMVELQNSPFLKICPIKFNGSGDISAAIRSTGIALHPSSIEVLEPMSLVEYFSW